MPRGFLGKLDGDHASCHIMSHLWSRDDPMTQMTTCRRMCLHYVWFIYICVSCVNIIDALYLMICVLKSQLEGDWDHITSSTLIITLRCSNLPLNTTWKWWFHLKNKLALGHGYTPRSFNVKPEVYESKRWCDPTSKTSSISSTRAQGCLNCRHPSRRGFWKDDENALLRRSYSVWRRWTGWIVSCGMKMIGGSKSFKHCGKNCHQIVSKRTLFFESI